MHPPLHILNARVLTFDPASNAPPSDWSALLGVVPAANVAIDRGVITHLAPAPQPLPAKPSAIAIDARSCVLMPAFVDCHTHLCWAGSRLDEWERKLAGASYLEILNAGGGIMSTVRAVRDASQQQLTDLTLQRLHTVLSLGTTTIEIKSGYGLTAAHELKMLRAIHDAASRWPGTVIPTALLGHAIDPAFASREVFIDHVINDALPAVHAEFPRIAIDAYCEQGAWSVAECVRLFEKARDLGHPIRVHADQFNSLGMVREAARLGAISVDHLEASSNDDWTFLASSSTAPVILPCCGFHLDNRYAKPAPYTNAARATATPPRLCIATNSNPGSAPCLSMPTAIALAVRQCGLPIPLALHAATRAPASLLGLHNSARIRIGDRADLLLLSSTDERDLAYRLSDPSIIQNVIVSGRTAPPHASMPS